jgi:hypothetical protein
MPDDNILQLEALRKSAKERKKHLKAILKNLVEQHRTLAKEYTLIKKEIQLIDNRIEKKISETEFCQYLDTVRLEVGELRLLKVEDDED